MIRSSKVVLTLFACAAASCAWLAVRSGESIVSSAVAFPAGPAGGDPPADAPRNPSIPPSTRRAVQAATHRLDSVVRPGMAKVDEARAGLVRVSGRVRRAGRALANYSLAFHDLGAGPDADKADWDFTDEDGRYEVRVPPADYRVLDEDHGVWLTNVAVPSGRPEQVLDIELPIGLVR